jgi:hypothetical protein
MVPGAEKAVKAQWGDSQNSSRGVKRGKKSEATGDKPDNRLSARLRGDLQYGKLFFIFVSGEHFSRPRRLAGRMGGKKGLVRGDGAGDASGEDGENCVLHFCSNTF